MQQRQQHARVQSGLTEQRVDGRAFVPFVLIHGARAEGVQGRNFGTEYDFSIDAKPMMLQGVSTQVSLSRPPLILDRMFKS